MEFAIAPHLGSGVMHYHLEDHALRVVAEKSGREDVIPFSRIQRIHLREDMVGVFSADIRVESGPALRLTSRHFLGLGRFEDRGPAYGAFMRALVAACGRINPTTELLAGSSLLYGLGWVLVVLAIVMGLLVGAALLFGATNGRPPPVSGLLVLPLALVVGGGFIRQGRGKTFVPTEPPARFLPGAS